MAGGPNAKIYPPMIIFENDACSYSIQEANEDVQGVSYHASPWVYMDNRIFIELPKDKRLGLLMTMDRKQLSTWPTAVAMSAHLIPKKLQGKSIIKFVN